MITNTDALMRALVFQSSNEIFYMGNTDEGAKSLVRESACSLDADRASVWLYSMDRTSIVLQQLYVRSEDSFHQGMELFEKDFPDYFNELKDTPIIVANDAETHHATACFLETYLRPLGIKSMLDVPIWYKGSLIGVICVESFAERSWTPSEVDFLQVLSSLYSFSHSVRETNDLTRRIRETEEFLDKSVIISATDAKGRITYVNDKFTEISGWSLKEVLGQDHSIVNSGTQPDGYWGKMYDTVLSGGIWNDIVTNRAKDGSIYYVDTYIRARFDEYGKLEGFSSIRQDVTDIMRNAAILQHKELQLKNRMTAINRSNAVIEFDLEGYVQFANSAFTEALGYSSEELIGKHHSMLLFEEDMGDEYDNFWELMRKGEFSSGEICRKRKDGSRVYLQATYNPIIGEDDKPYRVLKVATDISLNVQQQHEIQKKNTYLEHAAKILRHDMHSGINTYIPRGLGSLERRMPEDRQRELKIDGPIKMIKEGLRHTQKVYKGVYEFTNLVKKDVVLTKDECNLKAILEDYLSATAYKSQVLVDDLGVENVNEALFCTALDNLIRNGLKYNDSDNKFVKIYREGNYVIIEDNGRGLTREEFKYLSQPYVRKEGQKESGSGLGLNICIAILEEHGFLVDCDKLPSGGTQIKITLSK